MNNNYDNLFQHNPKNNLREAYRHIEETAEYQHKTGFENSYETVFKEIKETLDQESNTAEEHEQTIFWENQNEELSLTSQGNPLNSFSTLTYINSAPERTEIKKISLDFREGRQIRGLLY